MPTYRCTMCALNWPVHQDFDDCPQCGEVTDHVTNVKSMPEEDARSLKAHLDFERFYEAWDADKDPDRLKPTADELAAAQPA